MPKSRQPTAHQTAGNGPQLSYSEGGRSGTIRYTSSETSFDIWYEFAMPPALVIIGIPESRHWEAQTKIPLSQREDTLQFIANQVIKDKLTGDGYALFDEQFITLYPGKVS
ncbi:MAG: hypothetical protein EOO88_42650 [Pedobacter sp.]|nr:MAG: hypothetical protein EOO88_42650 [Pedobacter sp.]